MDATCIICLEQSDACWTCECCNKRFHWECVGKWWVQGRGCPHCRHAQLESMVEKYTGRRVTTAESIMVIGVITTILTSSGQHETLSSILEID